MPSPARVLAAMLLGAGLGAPALALDGIVHLPDGQPAVDAQVLVLGQTGSARTGPDGRFTWVPEPRPPFQLLAILPGGLYTQPVLVEALPADGSPKPIPGYGVLDAGGTLRLAKGLEARLVLGNAFDHSYFETPDELAVPAPGRRASLTLSGSFTRPRGRPSG